jgi:hypothetical protein
MDRACSTHKMQNGHNILAGTRENKRRLERCRHRWTYNIKIVKIQFDV